MEMLLTHQRVLTVYILTAVGESTPAIYPTITSRETPNKQTSDPFIRKYGTLVVAVQSTEYRKDRIWTARAGHLQTEILTCLGLWDEEGYRGEGALRSIDE